VCCKPPEKSRPSSTQLYLLARALTEPLTGAVASFTGDGAYDQDGASTAVAGRHLEASIIVPPRATAVPSATAETTPTQRDRHLQSIAEHGRMAWQRASGYTKRARAEATIGRLGGGEGRRTVFRHDCGRLRKFMQIAGIKRTEVAKNRSVIG
jgi:hypothetical protein